MKYLALLLLASILSATPVTDKAKPSPSLEFFSNPNKYLLALPIDGQVLEGAYTNIRFQPYATPYLYDETVLFCGDVTEAFSGKSGPVVITYKAQASHKYKGIGCHTLISVFSVKTE